MNNYVSVELRIGTYVLIKTNRQFRFLVAKIINIFSTVNYEDDAINIIII